MANGTAKITRTFGTATNRDKWTLSMWVKLNMVQEQGIFFGWGDASNYTNLEFGTNGQLTLFDLLSGGANCTMVTSRWFRDFSAWYHIVISWDSGNATPGERVKFYTNGVRETAFATETYPAQDNNSAVNGPNLHEIGAKYGSYDFSGCMSHVQFVDGLALAPTEFGEFDSTSGIWKIKTGCYATPGTNGFCLKMEDRTNLDLDSSSNAHTFATTGTLTATYDNPSNNFATWNSLNNYLPAATFSNGNTTVVTAGAVYAPSLSTLGMNAGKWYAEFKTTARVAGTNMIIGVSSTQTTDASYELGQYVSDWGYDADDGSTRNNNTSTAYGDAYDTNDIVGIALDLDNNKLYFSKNGVWQNSGVPTSGATGTGALSITAGDLNDWFFGCTYHSSGGATISSNFGNGYFGTTAVVSTNADDAGIGSFEYDVPAGFYAVCTKNIKAYGG